MHGGEPGRGVDGGRVEHQRGGPVRAGGDLQAGRGEDRGQFPGDGGVPGGEVEDGAGQCRCLQGPASQPGGLREAELAGEELAGCRAGQVQIAVGHCPDSLLGRRFTPE